MSFEVGNELEKHLNPKEFASSLYENLVTRPYESLSQISGNKITKESKQEFNFAGFAGELTGSIIKLGLLTGLSSQILKPVLAKQINPAWSMASKLALAGSIDAGLLSPSKGEKNLVIERLEHASVAAATFGVMGGMGKYIESTAILGKESLGTKALSNGISGALGGLIAGPGNIYLNENRLAKSDEILFSAFEYGLLGTGLASFHHGLNKLASSNRFQELKFNTKYYLEKKALALKGTYYETLDAWNLRHPIRQIQDSLFPVKLQNRTSPALTETNNPALSFEREYAKYFKQVEQKELEYELKRDRAIYLELREIKAQFTRKLMEIWHGNGSNPGFVHYSDKELATGALSAERVGQIRQLLRLPEHNGKTSENKLGDALAKLAPPTHTLENEAFYLLEGMYKGKESFFNFNTSDLAKKLSLPQMHHSYSRSHLATVNWFPFESTAQLTNFFHGTNSKALDRILLERALIPARELHQRRLGQLSGESLGSEFPSKAISMTRDFTTALAYAENHPLYLTEFPVIFGISKTAAARSRLAGFLEPGEILVDRLNIGSSVLTRLGLRRQDITHVYVPDNMQALVNEKLALNRIKGVEVIGFNQLKEPKWLELPEIRDPLRH